MAPRVSAWACRGLSRPLQAPGAARQRHSSSTSAAQTRFSYLLPARDERGWGQLLAKLGDSAAVANPHGHDAALLLATPGLTKQLESSGFVGELTRLLSGPAHAGHFDVLCAVVDHVAPARATSGAMGGISVLRGRLDDTLPGLWRPPPPRSKEDADSLSALTFDLGSSRVTLPLARTTFQNGRTSTLLASRFDMAHGSPRLVQQGEKHAQRITVSLSAPLQSTSGLRLWAPLSPITRARVVTESFGNIVKGVQVDGKTAPASTELEEAVNAMFEHRPASDAASGPMGVWAMIAPNADAESAPDPTPMLQGKPVTRDAVEKTAQYLERVFKSGGRLYQILSGGGGWGAKKGLLSIDPQRTHFSLSEEEEMARFLQTMGSSGFASPGSQVQFFIPVRASAQKHMATAPLGVVFGVPGDAEGTDEAGVPGEAGVPDAGCVVDGHFGALSSRGVFIAGPPNPETGVADESKLSVPNSRLFIAEGVRPA